MHFFVHMGLCPGPEGESENTAWPRVKGLARPSLNARERNRPNSSHCSFVKKHLNNPEGSEGPTIFFAPSPPCGKNTILVHFSPWTGCLSSLPPQDPPRRERKWKEAEKDIVPPPTPFSKKSKRGRWGPTLPP